MKRGSKRNRLLDRRLGIPALWLLSGFRRRRSCPPHCGRIGVLVSPTIGDNLLSSVVAQDLRRHYPDATIIYFSAPTSFGVTELLPGVDEIVPISMTNPWLTVRNMRKAKLDVLLDLTPWQRLTAFYAAVCGAKFTVGFQSEGQYRHWAYDRTVKHSRLLHEVDNFRQVVREFGVPTLAEPALKLTTGKAEQRISKQPFIVFHPWASGDRSDLREWDTNRWCELALKLRDVASLVYVSASPGESARAQAFCELLQARGIQAQPYISTDRFRSLSQLLRKAALVVSVNTGVMHLSAILGAPTVGLSGPTSNLRWGPKGPRAAGVGSCSGCGFLHFGFEFDNNPTDCMEKITVDEVLHAAYSIAPQLKCLPAGSFA